MKNFYLATLILLMAGTAHATELTTATLGNGSTLAQNCKMVDTTTITASINNVSVEIGNAKKYMDDQIASIETIAKELGIEKFELQNSSMNVYSNNYNAGGCAQTAAPAQYQLNGSVTYNLNDSEKASQLIKKLEAKGYNLNLNSNAYRQCQ